MVFRCAFEGPILALKSPIRTTKLWSGTSLMQSVRLLYKVYFYRLLGFFCWCICTDDCCFRISSIRLLILLTCRMFFEIKRPSPPWDLFVAAMYMKLYPLELIDVVSSFVCQQCSCIATTSMQNVLHPLVSWWSLPGRSSIRNIPGRRDPSFAQAWPRFTGMRFSHIIASARTRRNKKVNEKISIEVHFNRSKIFLLCFYDPYDLWEVKLTNILI